MTSTIVPSFDNYNTIIPPHQNYYSPQYTLHWRRDQLLVKADRSIKQPYLPSLDNQQLLVNCLKHSPVNLVSIDGRLGETLLKFWAEACQQAHKPIFLRVPTSKTNSQPLIIWLWKLLDWMTAFVLLVLVIPLMLVLMTLMQVSLPKSMFIYEWRIGERGKLFQVVKFSTTNHHKIKFLGLWLKRSGLDKLPQLWNVLRGDMGLIGYRCLTLEDAVKLSFPEEKEVNMLPKIIGTWEIGTES